MTSRGSLSYLEAVVFRLCEDTSTPRALTVSLLWKYGEWDQLASLRCDPVDYTDAGSYRKDVIVTDFSRKLDELPTTYDRAAKALENFWKAERQCYATNERLSPFLHNSYSCDDEGVAKILFAMRKMIFEILGPCPDLIEGRFGPGATYDDRGRFTTIPDKMSSCPTLSPDALPFLFQWSGTAWASACAESDRKAVFVRGNRFTTVPKDCTKDRGICIEPSVNVFYQLGYGRIIRKRLSKVGIDLDYGQDTHRQLACEASIRGHLATIDLSNASDTVCNNLVQLLLPDRWYQLLSSLRSPFTNVNGKWVRLEKFSSMGNGFTFELETLIFFAICKVVAGPQALVSVYGDDLIVPTESAGDILAALRFLGFQPNKDKTFLDGWFRESCGGDFFRGVDVRPYYQKENPCEPQQYIALANGISRLGINNTQPASVNSLYHRAWLRSLDALPSHLRRLRGPRDLGDLVIHDDDESRWNVKWQHSIRYIKVYKPANLRKVEYKHFRPSVVLAYATFNINGGLRFRKTSVGIDISAPNLPGRFSLGVTPRDAVLGYKVAWVPHS